MTEKKRVTSSSRKRKVGPTVRQMDKGLWAGSSISSNTNTSTRKMKGCGCGSRQRKK